MLVLGSILCTCASQCNLVLLSMTSGASKPVSCLLSSFRTFTLSVRFGALYKLHIVIVVVMLDLSEFPLLSMTV